MLHHVIHTETLYTKEMHQYLKTRYQQSNIYYMNNMFLIFFSYIQLENPRFIGLMNAIYIHFKIGPYDVKSFRSQMHKKNQTLRIY